VNAGRREGLTGVWVENRKLASIGVGVRKWISMHGFAINITRESLPPFFAITPCGLDGVSMTCLENEAGREIPVREMALVVEREFRSAVA
jgi:lipoyl(octanoyl) transferase